MTKVSKRETEARNEIASCVDGFKQLQYNLKIVSITLDKFMEKIDAGLIEQLIESTDAVDSLRKHGLYSYTDEDTGYTCKIQTSGIQLTNKTDSVYRVLSFDDLNRFVGLIAGNPVRLNRMYDSIRKLKLVGIRAGRKAETKQFRVGTVVQLYAPIFSDDMIKNSRTADACLYVERKKERDYKFARYANGYSGKRLFPPDAIDPDERTGRYYLPMKPAHGMRLVHAHTTDEHGRKTTLKLGLGEIATVVENKRHSGYVGVICRNSHYWVRKSSLIAVQ